MSEHVTTARDRVCGHKFQHPSREAAIRHSWRLWQQMGYMANAYRCLFCGAWHVGGDARGGKQTRASADVRTAT